MGQELVPEKDQEVGQEVGPELVPEKDQEVSQEVGQY